VIEKEIGRLRARITELEQHERLADAFLADMAGELAQMPCCCENGKHRDTPPMMWPELIRCIIKRAVRDALAKREQEAKQRATTVGGRWRTLTSRVTFEESEDER